MIVGGLAMYRAIPYGISPFPEAGLVAVIAFMVAVLIFAFGLGDRGSVVGAHAGAVVAMVLFAVLPLLDALAWAIAPYSEGIYLLSTVVSVTWIASGVITRPWPLRGRGWSHGRGTSRRR